MRRRVAQSEQSSPSAEIESLAMPVRSAEIIEHLPGLRRYAVALVGCSTRADRLVEASLERLLVDQAGLNAKCLRLAMFALFDRVYEAAGRDAAPADRAPGALQNFSPDDRKALLLSGLARFSHHETAAILGISAPLVTRRLLAARARLRRAVARKVLVIADEPMVTLSIAQMLRHMGHELCGVARTRREAVARAHSRQPDLILADCWLGGDDGIATVREIVRRRPAPVIFLTGDMTDPIGAPSSNSAVMIRKPFATHTLEAAVRRVLGGAGLV
jgi:CheY-like chemotaxis protein/DNA-directed RNA polymerase specialized sigma24 family protein